MATISSHILDSVTGNHAAGIRVECYRLNGNKKQALFDVTANEEGRISESVDIDSAAQEAQYELVFHSADYFAKQALSTGGKQIMTSVVVRISLPHADARYHIPLVLSPHSYTIWWSG